MRISLMTSAALAAALALGSPVVAQTAQEPGANPAEDTLEQDYMERDSASMSGADQRAEAAAAIGDGDGAEMVPSDPVPETAPESAAQSATGLDAGKAVNGGLDVGTTNPRPGDGTVVPTPENLGTSVSAEEVSGLPVHDASGEQVGEVTGVVTGEDGYVQTLIIAQGGLSGAGARNIAVSWGDAQLDQGRVLLDMSGSQISELPDIRLPEQPVGPVRN